MKLYILKPLNENIEEFEWQYDKSHGHVVRAKNEERARVLAGERSVDEGKEVWMDNTKTSCIHLKVDGVEEHFISDVRCA